MIRAALALCLALAAAPLWGQSDEDIVADLSQNQVSINTRFDGSEILIFGAAKRNALLPEGAPPMQVVITVTGPSEPLVVRRKDRRFGIWVNTDAITVTRAPSFYAVASSVPLAQALSEVEDVRHKVSVGRAIRAVGQMAEGRETSDFTTALVRIKEASGTYDTAAAPVRLLQETLFSTEVSLPANLVEGDYDVRIFLTRDGAVTALYTETITVAKVGIERIIYNLAHDQPLVYGLLSLFIAISAGWGASAAFRLFQD